MDEANGGKESVWVTVPVPRKKNIGSIKTEN